MTSLNRLLFTQIFQDGIEALMVSYKKMNPFCVPFATTNMGSAILAMDLVIIKKNKKKTCHAHEGIGSCGLMFG